MAVTVEGVYVYQQEEKDIWSAGYGARWERRRDGLWRQRASQTEGFPWECVGEPMGINEAVRFSLGYDKAEEAEAAHMQAADQAKAGSVTPAAAAAEVPPLRIAWEAPPPHPTFLLKGAAEQFAERLEELVTHLGAELRHSEEQPYEGREEIRAAIALEKLLMRWRRKLDRLLSEVCECL